jgi:hypothetical protein
LSERSLLQAAERNHEGESGDVRFLIRALLLVVIPFGVGTGVGQVQSEPKREENAALAGDVLFVTLIWRIKNKA